jgi:predicted RNA polymerase sigma factor
MRSGPWPSTSRAAWRRRGPAWIDAALTAARPQALGALLRYFRDLDIAEEAFRTRACAP